MFFGRLGRYFSYCTQLNRHKRKNIITRVLTLLLLSIWVHLKKNIFHILHHIPFFLGSFFGVNFRFKLDIMRIILLSEKLSICLSTNLSISFSINKYALAITYCYYLRLLFSLIAIYFFKSSFGITYHLLLLAFAISFLFFLLLIIFCYYL